MHCVVANQNNIATSARRVTNQNENISTNDRLMLTRACQPVCATDFVHRLTRPSRPRRGDPLTLALCLLLVFTPAFFGPFALLLYNHAQPHIPTSLAPHST